MVINLKGNKHIFLKKENIPLKLKNVIKLGVNYIYSSFVCFFPSMSMCAWVKTKIYKLFSFYQNIRTNFFFFFFNYRA